LNKAILAVSIVVAAIAILFAYLQFTDLDYLGSKLPFVGDLVQTTIDGRRGLSDNAFQVGQISLSLGSDRGLYMTIMVTSLQIITLSAAEVTGWM
jgi:hypothetical protein